MTAATPNVSQVQASTFLEGATDVTLRKRPWIGWLDKAGRINRNATGKDWNWKLRYKLPVAQGYTAYDTLSFANDNYWLPASVTPEWWRQTSGMDITEIEMNTGPSRIIDAYGTRIRMMAESMEVHLAQSLFMDYAGSGAGRVAGLATIAKGSTTIACTTGDRLRAPSTATYAGLSMALGSQGGSWSSDIVGGAGLTYPMNVALGADWPDGHGDASQAYDGTSPRLYNENTSRWADPSATAAAATWRTNCIAMLSRANTDLRQNTVESMMPNIHLSAAQRHQDIKDKLREAFRDTAAHGPSEDLGYHSTLSFEGAAIIQDYECPADRTYSICAESVDLQFYPGSHNGGTYGASGGEGTTVTGGIYQMRGPTEIPGTLVTGWILLAGGQARYSPKWVVCHKNWVY